MDDPAMAGFVEQLDPVNALADASEGFVWRLQTEEGNATSIHAFEDDRMLVNMSVWESVEALDRLEQLREHGPTPRAFTFKRRFSPDEAAMASPEDERDFCPA